QLERLRNVMVPLLRAADHRMSPEDVRISIIDDPSINAASAGAGRYYINTGVALLEQLIPGSSSFTPIAGTLITNSYTRPLEIQADRHAVTLLRRAGYSKDTMTRTLEWLMRRNGDNGGGILSSHPATSERIQALRALR